MLKENQSVFCFIVTSILSSHTQGSTSRDGWKKEKDQGIQQTDQKRPCFTRNRPNQEMMVPDWLITSHDNQSVLQQVFTKESSIYILTSEWKQGSSPHDGGDQQDDIGEQNAL
eukprot:sb/3476973/